MNPILVFIIATIVNVTLSTIRSLCTINGGKWVSAITNAICYGFYPLIVMLTAEGTVDIIINMIITAVVNFVCVWLIKYVEEKSRKDKLWLVKITVSPKYKECMINSLEACHIPFNYVDVGKWVVFDTYCATQKETQVVEILNEKYRGKKFAIENQF